MTKFLSLKKTKSYRFDEMQGTRTEENHITDTVRSIKCRIRRIFTILYRFNDEYVVLEN